MANSYRPKKGFIYFLYDPEGSGMLYFDNPMERDEAATKAISDSLNDGEWMEEVKLITSGVATAAATEVEREDKPTGLTDEELDEAGWGDNDVDYRCNFRMLPF